MEMYANILIKIIFLNINKILFEVVYMCFII